MNDSRPRTHNKKNLDLRMRCFLSVVHTFLCLALLGVLLNYFSDLIIAFKLIVGWFSSSTLAGFRQ